MFSFDSIDHIFWILHTVRSAIHRGTEVKKRLDEALVSLKDIEEKNPHHTFGYMQAQWSRQKEMQALIISETAADKREQVLVLIELEEELLEAW